VHKTVPYHITLLTRMKFVELNIISRFSEQVIVQVDGMKSVARRKVSTEVLLH
jgi:hypothetical protein